MFGDAKKLKICFLGNFNVDYSSETHHRKSLESLGHEVVLLQEGHANAQQVFDEAMKCDLFIWVHTHGWETPEVDGLNMTGVLDKLKAANIPTATYHLDLWFGIDRQKDLDNDSFYKHIGHFFTVDKKMADWFNENTEVKGHYIHAGVFDQDCYMLPPSDERQDVIFVGSRSYHPEWQYRPQLIDWLQENYRGRFTRYAGDTPKGTTRGRELNQVYADTKVAIGDSLCLNFDYPYYWSDRVYETLGRGGFIIHPYIKGMEQDFEGGKHLVFYKFGDFDDLKRKINYYLERTEERESIRKAGHEHVKEHHTYKNRWQSILEELELA
jgi:hypothetical protein